MRVAKEEAKSCVKGSSAKAISDIYMPTSCPAASPL
jgi:hypothetical protein